MKKSNVIIYALVTIGSVFLLWLWYYLGLYHIDEPLDLVLSIIWWAMIVVAIVAIIQVEKRRKDRIRTVYVANNEIFNSEAGKLNVEEPAQLIDRVSETLLDLKYDFSKNDFPKKEEFSPRFFIRTSKISDDAWEGEVVNTWTRNQTPFKNREELAQIVATQS